LTILVTLVFLASATTSDFIKLMSQFPDAPTSHHPPSLSVQGDNSVCVEKEENGWELIACSYNSTQCSDGVVNRYIYYSTPLGTPPKDGWPLVIMFQGSFFQAEFFFVGSSELPFGGIYQVATVKALLDAGFAVIAPNAMFGGNLFWDTNLPPWDTMIDMGLWPTAPDAHLLKNLWPMISAGTFGPINMKKMHAAGISSGGYMSSRMAFFYPDYFKSVTIASASFYYCSGLVCAPPFQWLPGALLPSHPPALFLHGYEDYVVPISTMKMYANDMASLNLTHRVVVCDNCTHQWIPQAPTEVLNWVTQFNN